MKKRLILAIIFTTLIAICLALFCVFLSLSMNGLNNGGMQVIVFALLIPFAFIFGIATLVFIILSIIFWISFTKYKKKNNVDTKN